MVEVQQADIEAANSYLSPAKERTVDGLIQAFARHRQTNVQQKLDMAATWLENEASQRLHSPDIEIGHTVSVLEDVAAAIRKLGGIDGTD